MDLCPSKLLICSVAIECVERCISINVDNSRKGCITERERERKKKKFSQLAYKDITVRAKFDEFDDEKQQQQQT